MNKKTFVSLSSVLLILVATGCDVTAGSGLKRAPEPQSYSMDGVKFISPDISDGASEATMLQPEYEISASGRLLIRLESMNEKVKNISLGAGRKVSVEISLSAGESSAEATQALKLCPLQKNWMMHATWRLAYPMGRSGGWARDGGDFLEEDCMSGVVSVKSTNDSHVTLSFNATEWVVNDVKGRAQNFGLVLISANGARVRVRGDRDTTYSPRAVWIENP